MRTIRATTSSECRRDRRGTSIPSLAAALSLLLLVAPGAGVAAQPSLARAGVGNLRGIVLDTASNLLPGAQLQLHRLPKPPRLAITQDGGSFALDSVQAGSYLLSVRALGYKPAEFAVTVEPGGSPRYEIVMEPLPLELNAMVVEASFGRGGAKMAGFIGRMRSGRGRFVTSEQLERQRPNLLSDALQANPSLSFSPSQFNGNYRRAYAKRGGLNGGRCAMNLYIDGSLLPEGWAVDDVAQISEIAGIEIYEDWMSAPAQFVPANYDLRCGAIVIWTKRSKSWS
jgi:hypothetical protein